MMRLVYLVVGWAAVALGVSVVCRQFQEMDEQDQDQAVASYLNLRGHCVIDKRPDLKDKLRVLVSEIKSRWHKTPEVLIREFYYRHGVFYYRLSLLEKEDPLSAEEGVAGAP